MSLALDMIDAAMAADLTPNEHKVFLILFRQTVRLWTQNRSPVYSAIRAPDRHS